MVYRPTCQGGVSLVRAGGWCGAGGERILCSEDNASTAPPSLEKVGKLPVIVAAGADAK